MPGWRYRARQGEQLFGLSNREGAGSLPGRSSGQASAGEMLPGSFTRTISRVIVNREARTPMPDQPDARYPEHRPRKQAAGRAEAPPRIAYTLFCGFAAIVSYWDLFGFCGIFCGSYVNHAIFSTFHKFLQLFNDLIPAEIVNVFVRYMATRYHEASHLQAQFFCLDRC